MAEVRLEAVWRVHPDGSVAVAGLSFHVRQGEVLAMVGPSGSGKSTTLRLIAGLEAPSSGTIAIGGRVVNDLQPNERDVAMVFEGDSLYPHLTAGGNLRFGLETGRVPKPEIERRVQAESRVLGVARLLGRLPRSLSAGQRQRVAVGKATVRVPSVFLLDEPLTHLDAAERDRLRRELRGLQRGLGVTTIYVTHDQSQAMAIGDRVAVLRAGRIEQVGTPRELYRRPANSFVAEFVGSPGMSLLAATIERDGDGARIVVGGQRLGFPGTPAGGLRRHGGRPLLVGLRPEHVDGERAASSPPHRRLRLRVTRVDRLGPELLVACELPGTTAAVNARFPAHAPVRKGDLVEVAVDLDELSFFDPESGAALWNPA